MKNYFRLTKSATEYLADRFGTPLLVLSETQIERNYKFLAKCMPGVHIYYAVKANPDENIIRKLNELGSCFDVASDGEILSLAKMGVAPNRIIYANTVKTQGGLNAAKATGINKFTFDSESEIFKLAKSVPGGTVLLRIRVDNSEALVDLNKKFGASSGEAIRLLKLANDQGLDVAGLCFHVGSQSPNADAHIEALKVCRILFDEAKKEGLNLRILDIGGGFPIPTIKEKIDIYGLIRAIGFAIREYFPNTDVWCEPGRFICGTAVNLITKVIGNQVRNNQQWYFLDDGLYGTFSGVIFDHWDFELDTFKTGTKISATFAGPSCDSIDIMFHDKLTPPLEIDDLLLVPNCGAYTSASSTVFNGFGKVLTIVWEDIEDEWQAYTKLIDSNQKAVS